ESPAAVAWSAGRRGDERVAPSGGHVDEGQRPLSRLQRAPLCRHSSQRRDEERAGVVAAGRQGGLHSDSVLPAFQMHGEGGGHSRARQAE
ncbi:unnamed protein product, partial [Closterium sp. Naga37s-1]